MSKIMTDEHEPDLRSHDEIMLAARRMRAAYIRELFGKLRAALFSGDDPHGPALTPHIR